MHSDAEYKGEMQVLSGTVKSGRDSLSMHADVPVWCDCCTCEAEPYWVEAFRDENAENEVNTP